jgi:hypothetical protein
MIKLFQIKFEGTAMLYKKVDNPNSLSKVLIYSAQWSKLTHQICTAFASIDVHLVHK